MDDFLSRFWTNLADRWTGPFAFRFILQPVVGAFYAYRDGRKDASSGRTPYAWLLVVAADQRRALLREAWKAIGQVVIIGVVIDALYQIIVLRWIYPGELLVMVLVLAVLPYVLFRGLFTRLLR